MIQNLGEFEITKVSCPFQKVAINSYGQVYSSVFVKLDGLFYFKTDYSLDWIEVILSDTQHDTSGSYSINSIDESEM